MISGSGVNLEEHPPMPYPKEDTVRFVSVMRIMKDKGIEELLEAARRIHEKYPETVFELLGAYEEETRARYEPMIEDLAIQRDCALLWLPGRYAGVLPALSGGNPSRPITRACRMSCRRRQRPQDR